MPHAASSPNGCASSHQNPEKTHAYLVGGGISALAAAAFLIHNAHVTPSHIHILESSNLTGGSMDGAGDPSTGFILRGGRMLNFSYVCLYDLLSTIPSLTDSKVSVLDEIENFNAVEGNKTHALARIVTETELGTGSPRIADAKDFGMSAKDRLELSRITVEPENKLVGKKIEDFFNEGFFKSNFWLMWCTMFAFQPWHSAVEFRRYIHRFLYEFPRIDTLKGVDRTPYNQYDSIILPITTYLENRGVEFKYNTKVASLSYAESEHVTVEELHRTQSGTNGTYSESKQIRVEDIHIIESGSTGIIHVHDDDIVLITLGSITASSSLGSNTNAPPAPPPKDDSWDLWESLSHDNPLFGNPSNFCSRIPESFWESFTVTLTDPEFFAHLTEWTGNPPGTGALMTFKDSNWLMSIVVPHQPHFIGQPAGVQVFWGYALFPSRNGNFVNKPMVDCTGAEILSELLGHLKFPLQPTMDHAITIPCLMPYITSQFLTRSPGDRPQVIPQGSTNLAFMGQFVEIPLDVVFTVEYSVRGAQMAVSGLMGLAKGPKSVYRGDHDVGVLVRALKVLLEDGVQ